MVVGACRIELHLPDSRSLKAKRSELKPLLSRLHREFNVAAAEVDCNDVWQTAVIGVVTVSNDSGLAHAVLEQTVRWIELHHPDVQVVDWAVEIR